MSPQEAFSHPPTECAKSQSCAPSLVMVKALLAEGSVVNIQLAPFTYIPLPTPLTFLLNLDFYKSCFVFFPLSFQAEQNQARNPGNCSPIHRASSTQSLDTRSPPFLCGCWRASYTCSTGPGRGFGKEISGKCPTWGQEKDNEGLKRSWIFMKLSSLCVG